MQLICIIILSVPKIMRKFVIGEVYVRNSSIMAEASLALVGICKEVGICDFYTSTQRRDIR